MPYFLSQRENSHAAIRDSLAGKGKHWLKEDLAPNQFHVRAEGSLHPGQKMAEIRLPTQELLME